MHACYYNNLPFCFGINKILWESFFQLKISQMDAQKRQIPESAHRPPQKGNFRPGIYLDSQKPQHAENSTKFLPQDCLLFVCVLPVFVLLKLLHDQT